MNSNSYADFKWDELLQRINKQNVIPVLGPGLYKVRTPDNGDVLLYQYLAKKIAGQIGFSANDENLSFSSIAFQYLEKNSFDYLKLNEFLVENFKNMYLLPGGSLWKLSRIKSFPLFITTTYDEYLEEVLTKVRDYPTKGVHYTIKEKTRLGLNAQIFQELKERKRSLVFHIYGSANRNVMPSYTEKDILETIVTLQKDMESNPWDEFFGELKTASLLFIGCGYDDWLFRFFIRTITNKPYDRNCDPQGRSFIGDDFQTFHCGGLSDFLKAHAAEVFYSQGNSDFVDHLFQRFSDKFPKKIIAPYMFPRFAFISFIGEDRKAAKNLAENLKRDGIPVWLDELELRPGDDIDKKITQSISQCLVFIPIVSKNAQKLQLDDGLGVKYHIQEWTCAYTQYIQKLNPHFIMPIKIDDTAWMFRNFEKLAFLSIPGGDRLGEYQKLSENICSILSNSNNFGDHDY